ncbi:MAG TPA: cytochrome P450 [Solirubrobacteraceae bacterium]|nr:cytochrome P450 [Solirubrobacteraceae bacterium]
MRARSHDEFPVGAAVTIDELDRDPHAVNARLRDSEPVSWLPCLDGWLITRHDLALAAMRDAGTYTVDDPRFSTGQVIGPSMLSLDGEAHTTHRAPFVGPFRAAAVAGRFEQAAAERAAALVAALAPAGSGELRRGFAGPMSAAIVARALGLGTAEAEAVLGWYDAIVASVTSITAGDGATAAGTRAYASLRERLERVIAGGANEATGETSLLAAAAAQGDALTHDQIASNAAVLLFGGIETTEGMIANATLELLRRPELLERVRDGDPALLDAVIDESLRLEPAAAVIDRYATADTTLGGAAIRRGNLVRISIAGANRDPALFERPDEFDASRSNLRRHLAFAQGPHVCVGVHLARLEARASLRALLADLPGLRADPHRPAEVRGLVFRKPVVLHACWDP